MPRKIKRKPPPKKRVYFKLLAPKAKEVILTGSFNNWDTESRRLKRGKKHSWSTYMMLEPGTYEYRFMVDGKWKNDPEAETVPNPFNSQNCIKVVE